MFSSMWFRQMLLLLLLLHCIYTEKARLSVYLLTLSDSAVALALLTVEEGIPFLAGGR